MPINFLDFILSQNPTKAERLYLAQEFAQRAAYLYEECDHLMLAAECLIAAGELERALEIYLKKFEYRRAASLLLTNGRYQEAIVCYNNCIETLKNKDIEGKVSIKLGISACLNLMKQEQKKAKQLYKEARIMIEDDKNRQFLIAGRCWEALGEYGVLLKRDDLIQLGYEKALKFYGKNFQNNLNDTAKRFAVSLNKDIDEVRANINSSGDFEQINAAKKYANAVKANITLCAEINERISMWVEDFDKTATDFPITELLHRSLEESGFRLQMRSEPINRI